MNTSVASLPKPKPHFGRFAMPLTLLVAVAAHTGSAFAQSSNPAFSIKVLRGANQQTAYGSAFRAPLVVWVTEQSSERIAGSPVERPIPGVRVNFTPAAGIGLSASYAVTDEHGLASVAATGLIVGTSGVSADLAGFPNVRAAISGLDVEKATLTVVPGDLTAAVGAPIPAITTYTIRGFVNDDTEATANIIGSPVLSTTATAHSPHANYAIKGGVGTLSSPSYTFVAGFGTLAIVGGSEANNVRSQQDASADLSPREDPASVRPALMNQPAAREIALPAFLAGLHGESGVFVRDAIWQSAPVTSRAALSTTSIRTVLPTAAVDSRQTHEAPVQAVPLPKLTSASASSALPSSTRSALPASFASSHLQSTTSVRTAIAPIQPSSTQSTYIQPSIRRAFNPPGTK